MTGESARALEVLRDDAAKLYRKKGFQSRVGFGERPAILVIDLALAWTDRKYPLGSNLDSVVKSTNEILGLARRKKIPVIFTTIAYDADLTEGELYMKKMPAFRVLISGSEATKIDPRLKMRKGEIYLVKKWLSAFFGTNLGGFLTSKKVDTVIITGCSTSACVRATATDALGHGFRSIVVRECVGDRAIGPHEWNLFDIDAKMGDVVSKQQVLDYLASL